VISIRPVQETDYDEWHRLFTAYLVFYETQVPPEVYTSSFQRLLGNDSHDFHGALACADGQPVGLVHYLYHRHMWKVENVCYLQDLYADPEVRGTGVGRKLIEHVYAHADAAGCPAVYWLTQEHNETARKLYDRIARVTPFIRYNRPQ
jgi:GNAT superfamily N-acetyltransferase